MEQAELEKELEEMHEASFGWALACCGFRRSDAEDVLSASYLKVFEGRARFRGQSALKTWFFGVIRYTARERFRRRFVRSLLIDRFRAGEPPPGPSTSPESETVSRQTAVRLRNELAALPARQREVLALVFYQELTIEESAKVMGVALGTARTHYERGKSRLRARLRRGEEA